MGLDSHSHHRNDFDYQLDQLATHGLVCVIILPKHRSLRAQLRQRIYAGESMPATQLANRNVAPPMTLFSQREQNPCTRAKTSVLREKKNFLR